MGGKVKVMVGKMRVLKVEGPKALGIMGFCSTSTTQFRCDAMEGSKKQNTRGKRFMVMYTFLYKSTASLPNYYS